MHWYLARSLYPMHLLKNESAFAEIFRRRFRFRRHRHALAPVFCCDPEVFLRVYVQVEPVVQAERVLSESVGKRRKPFAFQYGALAPPSLAVREPSRVLVGFLASPPFHIFPFLTTRETKVNQHPPPPRGVTRAPDLPSVEQNCVIRERVQVVAFGSLAHASHVLVVNHGLSEILIAPRRDRREVFLQARAQRNTEHHPAAEVERCGRARVQVKQVLRRVPAVLGRTLLWDVQVRLYPFINI